jgi:2,4-dienoyl-CoA reductase-like NADH-dependent reductase (Old Yellow Enzyme family)
MRDKRSDTESSTLSISPGCEAVTDHDRDLPEIDLLSPLTLRKVTLRNRIAMSPMCQYVAKDGFADDWHLVHLGSRAAGGVALVVVEATAVTAEGRITPGDVGLWSDRHAEPLGRIARFVKSQGAAIGIQLAHAGRKASCDVPWNGGNPLSQAQGAWPILGPSALPFSEQHPVPRPLDQTGIRSVIEAFTSAARRAVDAGFDLIELHSAHGYLLHEFLSPLSNQRTDNYGGSLENRMRLPLEVSRAVREVIPPDMPLLVRISATDWVEGGWDVEQSVTLAQRLKEASVDLIDVSSGGIVPTAKIPVARGYQVPFAGRIRRDADILTGAVGLITETEQADEVIQRGCADLVFLARTLLRDPYWAIHAQTALNAEPTWPISYGYAVTRRERKK